MGIVVDTGVFVHWERRGQDFDQQLFQLDRPAYISAVTAYRQTASICSIDFLEPCVH